MARRRRDRRLRDSAATQSRVSELLSARVGNSRFLVLVAALVAIPLSIALGVWMAVRRDRPVDHVVSTATLVLAALPEFVIGIGLDPAVRHERVPVVPGGVAARARASSAWDAPDVLVLPAATLVLAVMPVHQPHHARLDGRGARERVRDDGAPQGAAGAEVIWRHAVPNAIVPAIQVAALQLA